MSKIEINLNPKKEEAYSKALQGIGSYAPWAGLAVAAVLVLAALLQTFVFVKSRSYAAYGKQWQAWEGKANLMREIKSGIGGLETEKNGLAALTSPKHKVVLIFEDIFSSLPKNIWLESMESKEAAVGIKGYVARWQEDYLVSLDKFINSLREKKAFSSSFSRINIKKSQKIVYNGVEALQFVLECKK